MYRLTNAELKASGQCRKKFPRGKDVSVAAATSDWNRFWSETLRRRFGDHKSAHKAVAEIATCGVRTVRMWFDGAAVPQCRYLSMLLATDDEIYRAYMEKIGRLSEANKALAVKQLSAVVELLAEVRSDANNER